MISNELRLALQNVPSGRSADRLKILAHVAGEAMSTPNLTERLKTVELRWEERSGELLPCVKVEFYEKG